MKIFIGEKMTCSLNYQYNLIYHELSNFFEITDNVSDADVIVFPATCCCTQYNLLKTLEYISNVLKVKKSSAKTYLTGCITRNFKENDFLKKVTEWLRENIDFVIPQNQPYLLLKLISNEAFGSIDINAFGAVEGNFNSSANIYISNGCLNNCSFCKNTFQHYPLKSVDFNELKETIDILDSRKFSQIFLKGTNICQYGLDIYHDYKLPEVISYIEKKENIKEVVLAGFAFKDAIQNGFQNCLTDSHKVVEICGSLESGSDRLLNLIRKGFTSEEIIDFVQNIRKRNYKNLYLNIIAGFPTETLDDVRMTLDVLGHLKPYSVDICRYTNSKFVDSNQYEQLSPSVIQNHTRIYSKVLQRRNIKSDIVGIGYKYNCKYN